MPGTQERYTKTFPISWEQLHRDSKALAWRLADMKAWQGIVTITRGGLVPASIIAREPEGRPLVDTFITEVSQDTWILFPWDTESQFVQPIIDIK